ncbi:hypothetical protein FIA58_017160 [Flavobacterium jejuense]|uniref:Type II secretion system protein GspC N-terminal domain-containing protein n=1 Tax=Flavobacterium jejuense TaxID=1544455 RepID=A0ABX0IU48_9FLAO|nr:hypothetical protein [Flavobacterium jejuense]NHN27412.1 hypothetical protein [Flavobacterium jejuense]
METKKAINIVLIIVVLSLWGTVSYKYINRFFGNDEIAINLSNDYNYNAISIIKKDTFALEPLTKDPFLNKVFSKPKEQTIRTITIPKPKIDPKPKEGILFPSVQYFGYIKSKDKKEELILIKINNRLERVRLNDNIDGLIINKIYKDSIVVHFNKETRSFKKNKG